MAFSLRQFLRRTPSRTLKSYCESRGLDLAGTIDWTADEKALVTALLAAIEDLPGEARSRLTADFERVHAMAGEVGEKAMLGAVADRARLIEAFSGLESSEERSLWLFLEDPDAFHRAEEIRYADYYRESRSWDGFVGPVGATLSREPADVKVFEERLKAHHRAINGSGRSCVAEIFERDGGGLTQVSVYLEGLPSSTVEFDGAALTRRLLWPAIEAAITYAPARRRSRTRLDHRRARRPRGRALCRSAPGGRPMNGPAKPRSCLARVQRRPIDVEAEKRAGWRAHGILVVAEDDDRLTWPERARPPTRRQALRPSVPAQGGAP